MSYLTFQPAGESASRLTKLWDVVSNGTTIALIRWYAPWRKYVIEPKPYTLWDAGCLSEVCAFLAQVNREHKINREGL